MADDARAALRTALVEKIRQEWGGRQILTPDGFLYVPPVRDGGRTASLIDLAVDTVLDTLVDAGVVHP